MAFQAAGKGIYSNNLFGTDTVAAGCYKCHTGEGYLQTKGDPLAQGFTPTADNVGKMGQECVTCHNGHPVRCRRGQTSCASRTRPASAAPRASRVDNASICEDCHNWQMEVLGTTPNPAPMADLAAHGGASHPQRETLHGRSVMFDVADGSEFMPGAECENCHMPKTNKAATRISHGMKPMLPGDAEKWNGRGRLRLPGRGLLLRLPSEPHARRAAGQHRRVAGQAPRRRPTAVVAAIDTAKTQSEFSATDSTKPGYVLVGRATWNYKAFENDASGSVHNPPYIMAGLQARPSRWPSRSAASTPTSPPSPSVKKNKKGHVAGARRQRRRHRRRRRRGRCSCVAPPCSSSTQADENGHFAFTFKVTKTYKNYKVKWARSGSCDHGPVQQALITIKCQVN